MAEHTITITQASGKLAPVGGRRLKAHLGDTIVFQSPEGQVKVNFPGPFGGRNEVAGGKPLEAVEVGLFSYQCGIKKPSGEEMGWPNKPGQSDGGEIEIIRR